MKRLIQIIFLNAIFLTNFIYSQTVEQRQFQLAQSYEKNGKLEDASRIYLELTQKIPDNNDYLTSWYRVTKQLNKYTELLENLEIRIKSKNDFLTNLLLAEAYWLKGRPNDANSFWKTAQNLAQTDDDYSKIASSMVSVRQFQKAIEVYLDGRKQFKQKNLFANDLIKIYTATGNFVNAADEIFLDFKSSSNLPLAQGRIYSLLINEDAKQYLIEKFEREYKSSPFPRLLELYIWFNRTIGEYQKALDITIEVDKSQKASYSEIFRFATQSRYDGQLDIALKAFAYIIENADKTNIILPNVLYGYAQTLEQKILNNKNADKDQLDIIKEIYQKIIKDFPNSSQQYDGFYQLAKISLDIEQNPQKSIYYLQQIDEKYGLTELFFNAKFELSRVYLFIEDFDKSKSIINDLTKKIPKKSIENFKDQLNNAYFNIAKIHYYQGQIDSTKNYLDKIQITPTSPITNDYLSFYSFITNNENMNAAIRSFAKAEFYELIRKYEESIKNYEQAKNYGRGSELEELSSLNIAEIHSLSGNLETALKIYEDYIDTYPNSVYLDEVYLKIAAIYQKQNKPELAESSYTKILVNFPKSIHYEEARKQIREIRNKKIQ